MSMQQTPFRPKNARPERAGGGELQARGGYAIPEWVHNEPRGETMAHSSRRASAGLVRLILSAG